MPVLLIGYVPGSKFSSLNPLSLNETGFLTLTPMTIFLAVGIGYGKDC
jgi:hypothetical protein